MVTADQVDKTSLFQIKRGNKFTGFVILGLCILFIAASFLLLKTNSLYKLGLFGRGEICGGWNTGGEIICSCKGKLVKPGCPAGARCDAASYICYGQCGDCCFKGVVRQSQYPNCSNSPVSSYEECVKLPDSVVTGSYPGVCITKSGERFIQPLEELGSPVPATEFPSPKSQTTRDFCDFDTSEKVERVTDCGEYLVLSHGCCDIPDTIVDRFGTVLASCGGIAGYSPECQQRFSQKNCAVISCKTTIVGEGDSL